VISKSFPISCALSLFVAFILISDVGGPKPYLPHQTERPANIQVIGNLAYRDQFPVTTICKSESGKYQATTEADQTTWVWKAAATFKIVTTRKKGFFWGHEVDPPNAWAIIATLNATFTGPADAPDTWTLVGSPTVGISARPAEASLSAFEANLGIKGVGRFERQAVAPTTVIIQPPEKKDIMVLGRQVTVQILFKVVPEGKYTIGVGKLNDFYGIAFGDANVFSGVINLGLAPFLYRGSGLVAGSNPFGLVGWTNGDKSVEKPAQAVNEQVRENPEYAWHISYTVSKGKKDE
jgi:hypothetical protein